MDFSIKLQIIFDLEDREERMIELKKLTQRYNENEELKELVQSKLKTLWKNEAIAESKIRDLFSPPSEEANSQEPSLTNLLPHTDGCQTEQRPLQQVAEARGSRTEVNRAQKFPRKSSGRQIIVLSDEEARSTMKRNKANESESDFDYGDSSADNDFSSESDDDDVAPGDPEFARINKELKAKFPGICRRDKPLLNTVVNYLRSNYRFEIKGGRRHLRFQNCIPRSQVYENVLKNCGGSSDRRFFNRSNFGKLFKVVFPRCTVKDAGTGVTKVKSYVNLVQVKA